MTDRVKTLCGYDGVYDGEHMFYVKLRQQENTNHTAINESWFVFFDDITNHQRIIGAGTLDYYEDLWSKSGPDYQVLDIGSYKLHADTLRDYPDLDNLDRSPSPWEVCDNITSKISLSTPIQKEN